MIVYHGSIRKFDRFTNESVVQHLRNDINTLGLWFTSNLEAAKPFAIGTESVIEKSATEFWEDGEPKVVQVERPVRGFIYKVYVDEPNLKEYQSNTGDSFDLFMRERDKYCDYLGSHKKNLTWKDGAILLNEAEANSAFRKHLINQGYSGFILRETQQFNNITDLVCLFSTGSLQIAEIMPLDGFPPS
ncbi:hypothetical protein SAMN05192533_12344 [Mesobacillus persicus]|uniref:Uncharacterized protein n=1 Tax=Mesobacillus persicus TaxID=930146 RepID=A0A1H8JZ14_9BACI|nr:hypothetical protein [Mesobacillus persicus]SEN85989.1 hypothetical protein SAMN05192533_12344 [Mesobacillus persicus]